MLRRSDIWIRREKYKDSVVFVANMSLQSVRLASLDSELSEIREKRAEAAKAVWEKIYGGVRDEIESILCSSSADVLPELTIDKLRILARKLTWEIGWNNEPF